MHGLVTIFGGSGFVGGQIVRALAKAGWRIRVAVRKPHLAYRLRMLGDVGQIEIVQANIRIASSVERALIGAEACINAVGQAFETGNQGFHSVHVEGARNVAEAAAARGITNFVQMSGIGADPEAEAKYARARGEGEAAVREAVPQAIIVRPSAIFGPQDVFLNSLAAMVSLPWFLLPAMPVFGSGQNRFAPVYVADVAQAVVAALSDPAAGGRTYELGGPTTYSMREITEYVMAETGHRKTLIPVPFQFGVPLGQLMQLPSNLLGIAPIVTSDQVILMKQDIVPAEGAPGLRELGVTPTTMESVAPSYLYRYRRGGQYAEATEAAMRS